MRCGLLGVEVLRIVRILAGRTPIVRSHGARRCAAIGVLLLACCYNSIAFWDLGQFEDDEIEVVDVSDARRK